MNFAFLRFWQHNFCIQHATFGHSETSLVRSITVRAQVLAATHEKRDRFPLQMVHLPNDHHFPTMDSRATDNVVGAYCCCWTGCVILGFTSLVRATRSKPHAHAAGGEVQTFLFLSLFLRLSAGGVMVVHRP